MRERITHPSAAYRICTVVRMQKQCYRVLDTTRGVGKILSFSASQLLSFSASQLLSFSASQLRANCTQIIQSNTHNFTRTIERLRRNVHVCAPFEMFFI